MPAEVHVIDSCLEENWVFAVIYVKSAVLKRAAEEKNWDNAVIYIRLRHQKVHRIHNQPSGNVLRPLMCAEWCQDSKCLNTKPSTTAKIRLILWAVLYLQSEFSHVGVEEKTSISSVSPHLLYRSVVSLSNKNRNSGPRSDLRKSQPTLCTERVVCTITDAETMPNASIDTGL